MDAICKPDYFARLKAKADAEAAEQRGQKFEQKLQLRRRLPAGCCLGKDTANGLTRATLLVGEIDG